MPEQEEILDRLGGLGCFFEGKVVVFKGSRVSMSLGSRGIQRVLVDHGEPGPLLKRGRGEDNATTQPLLWPRRHVIRGKGIGGL